MISWIIGYIAKKEKKRKNEKRRKIQPKNIIRLAISIAYKLVAVVCEIDLIARMGTSGKRDA